MTQIDEIYKALLVLELLDIHNPTELSLSELDFKVITQEAKMTIETNTFNLRQKAFPKKALIP